MKLLIIVAAISLIGLQSFAYRIRGGDMPFPIGKVIDFPKDDGKGVWKDELKIGLHPNKVFIKTIASGVDFLGWVNFPHHSILRTKTKRRMMSRVRKNSTAQSLASYRGLLQHGDTFKLGQALLNNYWLSRG